MTPEEYYKEISDGNIAALSKAITLNESSKIEDNLIVDRILQLSSLSSESSIVLSISGIPGVGKSTFIETFGSYLHSLGKSIAVFSIDPSSTVSHGSILGDKTRMNQLSTLDNVFVRPSPNSNRLGGLGINTHNNIELAKIAGYDVILIETVGVGQSEIEVKHLSDIFILLAMPSSGDELQGIKKGIIEITDFIVINKADGNLKEAAEKSKGELENALHIFKSEPIPVVTFSSLYPENLEDLWASILSERNKKNISDLRLNQKEYWFQKDSESVIFEMSKKAYQEKIDALKSDIKKGQYRGLIDILNMFND